MGARKMYTIGGNVNQAVTARKLNLRRDLRFSGRAKGPLRGSRTVDPVSVRGPSAARIGPRRQMLAQRQEMVRIAAVEVSSGPFAWRRIFAMISANDFAKVARAMISVRRKTLRSFSRKREPGSLRTAGSPLPRGRTGLRARLLRRSVYSRHDSIAAALLGGGFTSPRLVRHL